MARVRGQPKCRLITTRRRSYRNRRGEELIEPEDMLERSTVVTRRMSRVRESARKRRAEDGNQRKNETTVTVDARMVFFRCPLCTGTLRKGHKGFMDHIVEIHHTNPKKYVQNILARDYTFKEVESEDPAETENELVIGILGEEEFKKLKEDMMGDKNKVMQCSKAKYNMMIEKKHEEKNKIGDEVSTILLARGSNQSGEAEEVNRNKEQETEQRSLLNWAASFIGEADGGRQWWLQKLPVRGLVDYEGDKGNLLSLARELTAGAEWRGKEMTEEEMTFWFKCKLCIYRGSRGDLYRGSELFAKHIRLHHRISVSFYVNRFIGGQEIFIEHICGAQCEARGNCGEVGAIEVVDVIEENN